MKFMALYSLLVNTYYGVCVYVFGAGGAYISHLVIVVNILYYGICVWIV